MNVLVDTSVWSHALRRKATRGSAVESELRALVEEGRVVMMGAIRQELLSGIRTPEQFTRLRDRLRAFPDLVLAEADYEDAATCFDRCRSRGSQGSNTDYLMCAVARRRRIAILTTDRDFASFAKILDVKLHEPR